jgi:hypothetical protein
MIPSSYIKTLKTGGIYVSNLSNMKIKSYKVFKINILHFSLEYYIVFDTLFVSDLLLD